VGGISALESLGQDVNGQSTSDGIGGRRGADMSLDGLVTPLIGITKLVTRRDRLLESNEVAIACRHAAVLLRRVSQVVGNSVTN
jgi:hypothetical protein